jgi:hypothetical protein
MDKLMLNHREQYKSLFKKEIFHKYDYFLDRIITGTIIRGRMNNRLSRRVFTIAGNLAVTRHNRRSLKPELQPPIELVSLCRDLAFRSMVSMYRELQDSPVTRLDPRGKLTAAFTKKSLRRLRHASGQLTSTEVDERVSMLVAELIQGISDVIPG